MSKTRIFVSSTCYDLSAIRESIRQSLLIAGHEPVLSEYPSFPVSPNLTTVENCKKVVRENTDAFVLVVGGQRGSLDPETAKSVVNVEYETALESGLPIVVFVKKDVATYLEVWRKNPTTDFQPQISSPQVFEFLESVYKKGKWVFTFDKSGEIIEVLLGQLSIMLRDLLQKERSGLLQLTQQFANETPRVRQLVTERPQFWEYFLTIELLRSKLAPINKKFDAVKNGHAFKPSRRLHPKETIGWLLSRLEDFQNICPFVEKAIITDLIASWGPKGTPGDPLAIRQAVEKICEGCLHLLAWEEEVRFTALPEQVEQIQKTLQGMTSQFVEELNSLADRLEAPFKQPNPTGTHSINLEFKSPPNLQKLNDQLTNLRADSEANPLNWVGWF